MQVDPHQLGCCEVLEKSFVVGVPKQILVRPGRCSFTGGLLKNRARRYIWRGRR